ncbi:MAG: RagB/SusD family nutrient uptake outer membrane protein [Candidatus Nephrothrix sp. EaCA]|nr:MAG: RagB/SusD family nutrient uptake outer membrane protein [Candidatus Nephrothrix sp. EaCA]
MKKVLFIIAIHFALLSSCNKEVLNKQPLDIVSDANVWKEPALINAYLTHIYYNMPFLANESGGNSWSGDAFYAAFEVNEVSDECLPQWRDWNPSTAFRYKYGNLNIGGGLLEFWGYNTIREINVFLQHIATAPFAADEIKAKTAEARFLRAFCYFAMVKRYGGVPLITAVQNATDPPSSLFPERDKEQAVYDFILSETDWAAKDLPETVSNDNLGRPSKYAALALKSRAALYAGSIAQFGQVALNGVVGIPASLAKGYYQTSFDASHAIIAGGKHALYNNDADKAMNFRNIFLVKNNPEAIFVKRHDNVNAFTGGNGWSIDFFNCPRPQGWSRGIYDQAYLELAESFEHIDGTPGTLNRAAIQQGLWSTEQLWANKDPRFFGTFFTQNTMWKGKKLDFHRGLRLADGTLKTDGSVNGILANGDQDYQGTCIGILKYLDESHDNMAGASGGWPTSSQDWQIFRYAEILLNYAEAGFELGKNSEALDAVNQIRNRAGIRPLPAVTRDNIRHERKVELAFEGHRYWDARRWRTAVVDFSKPNSGINYILDIQTKNYQIKIADNIDGSSNIPQFRQENYYFPITVQRTSNNPKLLENPGY